jgi:hypothetical protein
MRWPLVSCSPSVSAATEVWEGCILLAPAVEWLKRNRCREALYWPRTDEGSVVEAWESRGVGLPSVVAGSQRRSPAD